jgi:aquaporin related protein
MQHKTCMTLPGVGIEEWQAFLVEFFCTFTLVGSVCAIWDPRNKNYQDSSGLRIGLIVAGLCTASIPFSGASMNSARSFGPALLNGHWDSHWIYWVAPFSGGLMAALISKFLFQLTLDLNKVSDKKVHEAEKKV